LTSPRAAPPRRGRDLSPLAAWTSPALFAVIAARVFAGEPYAPLLALTALLAPLIALLQPRRAGPALGVVPCALLVVAAGVVLWANLLVVGDLAAGLGAGRWRGVAVAGAVAFLAALWPVAARRARTLTFLAVVLAVTPVVGLAAAMELPPWAAWTASASRLAFRFTEGSAWAREGRTVGEPTTLTFGEPHRITAVAPGTWRVVERDGAQVATREWRLSPGDALALRPGDRLTVEAGSRLRFEGGKQVPGAPVSGAAWADPPDRRDPEAVAHFVGASLTLLGGALVLLGPRVALSRRARMATPFLVGAFVVTAAWAGVYALFVGADVGIGAASRVPFLRSPMLALGPPWGATATALVAVAMLVLLVATTMALRARVMEVVTRTRKETPGLGRLDPRTVWLGVFSGAVALALHPADPWPVLVAGLGLAACAWRAPGAAEDRPGLAVAVAAGTFAILTLARPYLPAWASVLGVYPLLAAAPLGYAAPLLAERAADGLADLRGNGRR
jgi:hypothetical protein